jgi:hypothetical protein
MTNTRMNEGAINASLDAFLHGAQAGDALQARKLHELLDSMLTEREGDSGQLWLTDHGRMVLADMHRQLSHCAGSGEHLRDTVLEAVQYKPHSGHWNDTCDYLHDLRIALTVANELCAQRGAGKEPDASLAVKLVADSGEFGLDEARISQVYDKIASTVHGFREIPGC